MFAAAFVKTGVDKRVCLMLFSKLAVPNVRWITLMLFVVITPVAAFVSDHALAAMFLPIGMLLYENSVLTKDVPEDPNLGKLLMMSIVMACNIGGPGAPSGGARNVIMLGYLKDMFGYDIGFFSVGHLLLSLPDHHDPPGLASGQLVVQASHSFPGAGNGPPAKRNRKKWASGTPNRSGH